MADPHIWAEPPGKVASSMIFEESVQLLQPRVATLDAQSVANAWRQGHTEVFLTQPDCFDEAKVIWILATCQQLRGQPVPGARDLVVPT